MEAEPSLVPTETTADVETVSAAIQPEPAYAHLPSQARHVYTDLPMPTSPDEHLNENLRFRLTASDDFTPWSSTPWDTAPSSAWKPTAPPTPINLFAQGRQDLAHCSKSPPVSKGPDIFALSGIHLNVVNLNW